MSRNNALEQQLGIDAREMRRIRRRALLRWNRSVAWRLAVTLGIFIVAPPAMMLLIDLAGDPEQVAATGEEDAFVSRLLWLWIASRVGFYGVLILLGIFMWWPYIRRAVRLQLQREGWKVCLRCGFVQSSERTTGTLRWTCSECGTDN